MATTPFIECMNVSVEKRGVCILRDITARLSERRIGVIGRNGSGKSTFAKLFNGLETPTAGTMTLAGVSDRKALRRHVGFVFQNPDNQIVYPIVAEDLAFGLSSLKLSPAEAKRRIDEILNRFGLSHLCERFTHQLSGGEKQMIALAGVLVMQPQLIVFDEPTTLLDLWNKRKLMAAIEALEQHVIVISHDLDLLADFDRILHLEGGSIVGDGHPTSIIKNYMASP